MISLSKILSEQEMPEDKKAFMDFNTRHNYISFCYVYFTERERYQKRKNQLIRPEYSEEVPSVEGIEKDILSRGWERLGTGLQGEPQFVKTGKSFAYLAAELRELKSIHGEIIKGTTLTVWVFYERYPKQIDIVIPDVTNMFFDLQIIRDLEEILKRFSNWQVDDSSGRVIRLVNTDYL